MALLDVHRKRCVGAEIVAGPIPKLGVGLAYQPQLRRFMETFGSAFDFVEVVPDVTWNDLGPGSARRYIPDEATIAFIEEISYRKPVIPHSIGLSIGSAHRFDQEHVEQMARWYERLRFPWHSDHLSFHLAEGINGEVNVNLTMPLPLDRETLEMIIERVVEVRNRIPVPFLLENNVYYFQLGEQDFDEATFLNELHRRSGCGLLLDLHNVYVNSRNHGVDPGGFLDALDLTAVVELHVAGGMEFDGMYLDAHSGTSPESVWTMLDWVLPRCPRVGGVVFELFGSWFDAIGEKGLLGQLLRMKDLWHRHQPTPVLRGSYEPVRLSDSAYSAGN